MWNIERNLVIDAADGTCSEGLLIIGIVLTAIDYCFVLVALDFLLFYETCFFGSYSFKENGCRFVIGVLGYELTLYGPLEYAVAELLAGDSQSMSILNPRMS